VQTTNPELRKKMLNNRHAGEIFPKLRRLADAGIEMNGQIVLCRGLNDGEELERSIRDLYSYMPAMRSVSIVPVGLSKYREGLYPLESFEPEDAGRVIDCIEKWQKKIYAEYGTHFVQASDEWYLLAGRPVPEPERYDGYQQLENGVGMLRLLDEEVREEMANHAGDDRKRRVTIATGRLAGDWMRQMCRIITENFPNVEAEVVPIRNDFFGEKITVSGLITGTDLITQLKGRDLGDALLLPCNMLRSGENVLLDDMTVEQIEETLQIKVIIVESDGRSLVEAVTGMRIG
jgi:putative radical SAM enzyme (TIGR03279 family)